MLLDRPGPAEGLAVIATAGTVGDDRWDLITFTSDFGLDDTFVGVCHAVLADAAPHARIIDLTHAIDRGDVRHGATALARAVPHTPAAVHLAVVDPGVGGQRRGIAVAAARGDVLVGPDNGLLLPAAEVLGGVVEVRELRAADLTRPSSSATFHGRDLFAPAAAAVVNGTALEDLGPRVDAPERLPPPYVELDRSGLAAEVALVDRFGNLQLAAPGDTLDDIGLTRGDVVEVRVVPAKDADTASGDRADHPRSDAADAVRAARAVRTFVDLDPGQLGVHRDSDDMVAVVVRDGSAAELLDAGRGAIVRVQPIGGARM